MLTPSEFLKLERGLTKKQRIFVDAYMETGNATHAARLAYPDTKSHSTMGYKMINADTVKLYISELDERSRTENRVTRDMLVEELKRIAFFDANDITDANGHLNSKQAIKKHGRVVKKIKFNTKTKVMEVELYSKDDAIEKLAKHIGFYKEDNDQKAVVSGVAIYLPDNGRGPAAPEPEQV